MSADETDQINPGFDKKICLFRGFKAFQLLTTKTMEQKKANNKYLLQCGCFGWYQYFREDARDENDVVEMSLIERMMYFLRSQEYIHKKRTQVDPED